jgi:hypothetical protein
MGAFLGTKGRIKKRFFKDRKMGNRDLGFSYKVVFNSIALLFI